MQIPRVSLGTMLFGTTLNKSDSFSILDEFYDLGGRVIDTAQMYPVPCSKEKIGLTEKIIGEWLISNNLRSEFFISSKIAGKSDKLKFLNQDYSNIFSKKHLMGEIYKNLSRLKVDYLDVLYLHWPVRKTHNFGLGVSANPKLLYEKNIKASDYSFYIENIFELYKQGLIRNIGISNETPYGLIKFIQEIKRFNYNGKLYLQNPINLLSPSYVITLQEICFREKISVQAHSPLAFGLLTQSKIDSLIDKKIDKFSRFFQYPNYFNRYSKNRSDEFILELDKLAKRKNINIYDLAYGFLLNDSTISHVVIGPRTKKQLRTSVKSIVDFEQNNKLYSEELYQIIEKYSIVSF